MSRIDEIREREAKATKGPWTIRTEDGDRMLDSPAEQAMMGDTAYYPWTFDRDEDWEFVAASREDIPWLLSEHDRLSLRVKELEEGVRKLRYGWSEQESITGETDGIVTCLGCSAKLAVKIDDESAPECKPDCWLARLIGADQTSKTSDELTRWHG